MARATTVDRETGFPPVPQHNTGAMPHPHWPLFDLEVRTPRLDIAVRRRRHADGARDAGGERDPRPAEMPFAIPWTDIEPPELERAGVPLLVGLPCRHVACQVEPDPRRARRRHGRRLDKHRHFRVRGHTDVRDRLMARSRIPGPGPRQGDASRDVATRVRRLRRRTGDDRCVHRQSGVAGRHPLSRLRTQRATPPRAPGRGAEIDPVPDVACSIGTTIRRDDITLHGVEPAAAMLGL